MSSHGDVGWFVRGCAVKLGDKQVLADGSGTSVFAGAPIVLVNGLGHPLFNTYTLADGSWKFWDMNAVDGIYYAYTVGLGEDWRIVITNPTATVTQVHYAARSSSQAFFA